MIYRIRSCQGRLAEELMLSTLPERLTKQGHKVYLLDDPENLQVKPFVNDAIKKFVYNTNPFVIQEVGGQNSKGLWNCGDTTNLYSNTQNDFISNWESAHGLTEPFNKFPKLYVNPEIDKSIQGIIDFSSTSLEYNEANVRLIAQQIMKQFPGFVFYQVVSPYEQKRIHVKNVANLNVVSLNELYDVVCSAKVLITLNSGTNSLAAAAREHNPCTPVYCILPQSEYLSMMDRKLFIYPSITYLKENEMF